MQRISIVVAALALVTSTSALAQHQQHGGHGQMMGNQGAGMTAMAGIHAFTPANLLEHRDELTLTEQQIVRITELRVAFEKIHQSSMAGHDKNHQMLMEVLTASEPNLSQARGYFDAAHASMGAAHWAEMKAGLEARMLLTPAQQEMVRGWSQ